MGAHGSGDGAAWDVNENIDADQPHGLDYRQFNHLAVGVRKRLLQEHSEFADLTVGGIHKPGGCAVLGMEITDTAVDPTDLVVPDGTYRGHGIIWAYDDASNSGTLWCATAAAGASTTGDWTLMKLHPDDQWGGGDVTWVGAHAFQGNVDMSDVDITGSLDVSGDVGITGDLSETGDVSITGAVYVDSSLDCSDFAVSGDISVAGVIKVDGTATEFGGTAGIGLFHDPTAYGGGETSMFGNGLIIKMGSVARADNDTDISFGTAFPNGIVAALANGADTAVAGNDIGVHTLAATGMEIRNTEVGISPMTWLAIGY